MWNRIRMVVGQGATAKANTGARPTLETLEGREVPAVMPTALAQQMSRDFGQFVSAVAPQVQSAPMAATILTDLVSLKSSLNSGQAEKVVGDVGKLGKHLLLEHLLAPERSLLGSSAVNDGFMTLLKDAVFVQYLTPGFGSTTQTPGAGATNPWGYGTKFTPEGYAQFNNSITIVPTTVANIAPGILGPSTSNIDASLKSVDIYLKAAGISQL